MKRTIVIFTVMTFLVAGVIFAEESSTKNELGKKIEEYQNKLTELKQQKNTISSQIQYMDTEIYLTGLKIQDTEKKITETQNEIELLSSRIEGLDTSLNYLSKMLLQRIVDGYKKRSNSEPLSELTLLLDTRNAYDFLNRLKYLKTVQDNNQKLLIQVQETKTNFEEQRVKREENIKKLDTLEKQLNIQKVDLNYQRKQKQIFLTETQNNESKYQQLLNQALAEYNAVQQAIVTGSKVGPIKKGEPFALVGNTGYPYCSTGPHLHFEIRVNNSWVNPEGYLSSKGVEENGGSVNIGGGDWSWPIDGGIVLEQRFGTTPWSWRYSYSGGVHTGIDIWSRSTEVIRAPADGTLYSSVQGCSGATINVKYIDHSNGLMSFYLHVQ